MDNSLVTERDDDPQALAIMMLSDIITLQSITSNLMGHLTYTIQIEFVHGDYITRIPAIPGCIAFANSYEQSVLTVHALLIQCLERLALHGQPIPVEPESSRAMVITVPAPLPVIR